MKKLTLILLISSNLVFSQQYDIYIIERKSDNLYLKDAVESGNTQAAMQKKYDKNLKLISINIQNIYSEIEKIVIDSDYKKNIKTNFGNSISEVSNLFKKSPNSILSNVQVNQIINKLYNDVNVYIKIEFENYNKELIRKKIIEEKTKNEVIEFINFHGGYESKNISEYSHNNGKWNIEKTNNGFIYYDGYVVYFKKTNENWKYRELIFEKYDEINGFYIYNSEYGKTLIDKRFTQITFFNLSDDKKYIYQIGNYDKNIKPSFIYYDKNNSTPR